MEDVNWTFVGKLNTIFSLTCVSFFVLSATSIMYYQAWTKPGMFVSLQHASTLLKNKIESYVVQIPIKVIWNQKGKKVIINKITKSVQFNKKK